MNKTYFKYNLPLSAGFILLCMSINRHVVFVNEWGSLLQMDIPHQYGYYFSVFYLTIVSGIICYYFYIKMVPEVDVNRFFPGYFILSVLMGYPILAIGLLGSFAHYLIAASLIAGVIRAGHKVWTMSLRDEN